MKWPPQNKVNPTRRIISQPRESVKEGTVWEPLPHVAAALKLSWTLLLYFILPLTPYSSASFSPLRRRI